MEVVVFNTLHEGFANFPKILDPRTVARSKFQTEGPQILGAALQNLVSLILLSVSDTEFIARIT